MSRPMLEGLRGRVSRVRDGYLARPFTSLQLLLLSGAVLLTFGILMSVSTSISASTSDHHGTLWTQMAEEVVFVGLGLPILWLGARIPPRVYRMLVYPVLLLAAIMLVAVFVPHVGVEINDARRWLKVGPVQIQPSEFAKLAMLLWAADLLATRSERGDLASPGRILWPVLPGFALVSALVVTEPDLGTTLCFLTMLIGLLWTVGLPYRYFVGVVLAIAASVLAVAVYDHRRWERITSFLHPLSDTSNTGHQALQGLYALSSGGIFGVGLGAGPLKFGFVPNANTDYVFAIIGEELGLLGCLFVLAAFGLFAYAALRVARRSEDCFTRLAASGTAVWICGQALINIGYVTGLLPVTGIPLPFVSAGGTSLVLTMGVLGMLVSFARHEPAAVAATRAAAAAGERSGVARWTRLGVPRVAVPPAPPRAAEKRPAQKGVAQKRPAQARSDRARSDRARTDRPRPDQGVADRARPDRARTDRPRPDQPRPARPAARSRGATALAPTARAAAPERTGRVTHSPRPAAPRSDASRSAVSRSAVPPSAAPHSAVRRSAPPRGSEPYGGSPRAQPAPGRGSDPASRSADPASQPRRRPTDNPGEPRSRPVRSTDGRVGPGSPARRTG